MENKLNSQDFLQSSEWRKFQENLGRKTFHLEDGDFSASLIVHELPVVGKYFYCPRGPVIGRGASNSERGMQDLLEMAKKENIGWIRIDPESEELLQEIKDALEKIGQGRSGHVVIKASHDMQPKEVFVLDIMKPVEQLLAGMKPKTRYNVKLAEKKGVIVKTIDKSGESVQGEYVDAFLRLTKEMAARHGITTHPENHYRKMIESLPSDMLKIYAAEFEGKMIAANLVLFYGNTATYLHGASGNENRNVMAPFLLQWQAISDAKKKGCLKYDFGGVKTVKQRDLTPTLSFERRGNKGEVNTWEGITTFKLGFSPDTKPVMFPGSYDIIINPRKYAVYRGLQKAKELMVRFRK